MVSRKLIIGVTTEVIAGEVLILTAGGFDTPIHFICAQQVYEAVSAGLTTMVGGGTGPAVGISPHLHARNFPFGDDVQSGG